LHRRLRGHRRWRVTSLICGILGVVGTCCCGVLGIPLPLIAIVTGGIALANPNDQGRGMAIAGVILGGFSILLVVLIVVIMLMDPNFADQFQ
jgi:hypothetical protein